MAATEDLDIVERQEKRLVFDRFDDERAIRMGVGAVELATREGRSVAIDLRLWNRPVFFAALPGAQASHADWARRKINTVGRFLKSTYRLALEMPKIERLFPPEFNLPPSDYVLAGGAFPITVAGTGVIGALAVSGLPARDDHMLVARMLCAQLGIDPKEVAAVPS